MRSLSLVLSHDLANDQVFDASCASNRDNCLLGFRLLQDRICAKGGRVHTEDVWEASGLRADVRLFFNVPREPLGVQGGQEQWVFLQENPLIWPKNEDALRQRDFSTVFTWNDDLVDGQRFVKLNQHLPFDVCGAGPDTRPGHLVVIAGNKRIDHDVRELYSKRLDVVRHFDRAHPGSVQLYGHGWDRRVFPWRRPWSRLNSFATLTKATARPPRAYMGRAGCKADVFQRYRFALCFENARDLSGYITEKLFDAMLAGAVPVYWGANNIADHVPPTCFIDYRELGSPSALREFLGAMSDQEIAGRQRDAWEFLATPAAHEWSAEHFAEVVTTRLSLL